MPAQPWIVACLVVFDLGLLAYFYVKYRGMPRLDNRTLTLIGGGLAGFVFHAFMFLDGVILIVQLTAIAAIFGLCWLQHKGLLHVRKPDQS
jgi:hypothetical protein